MRDPARALRETFVVRAGLIRRGELKALAALNVARRTISAAKGNWREARRACHDSYVRLREEGCSHEAETMCLAVKFCEFYGGEWLREQSPHNPAQPTPLVETSGDC